MDLLDRLNMGIRMKWRLFLIAFLLVDLCAVFYFVRDYLDQIPNQLYAIVGESQYISLPFGASSESVESKKTVEALQVTNREDGFTMVSNRTGTYQVPVKLFGIVPIKSVDVKIMEDMKLAPSGEPIGIYVETNGLLVLDTAEFQGKDGLTYAPSENTLRTGDYILQWNHQSVPTIEKLNQAVQKTGNKQIKVTIRRGNKKKEVKIRPVMATDRTYKIGAWIREDTQGIGTLTYLTEQGEFGTLGHGITDADTGELLNLQGGELYQTRILGILKGASGEPGELQGYINMIAKNQIGTIEKNTSIGVFGTMNPETANQYADSYLPVGMKQNIKKGKAYLYTKLGGEPAKYEIRIEKIYLNSTNNKSMVIRVVDPDLLARTGGIVQGMSGSPILQDGKIIGAVTHVMVDDPTSGYGVFIENMLAGSR